MKQLDLVKFIKQQRMMMHMTLSNLTSSQLLCVDKLSKLEINEYSNPEDTPSDENSKHFEPMKDIQKSLMHLSLLRR